MIPLRWGFRPVAKWKPWCLTGALVRIQPAEHFSLSRINTMGYVPFRIQRPDETDKDYLIWMRAECQRRTARRLVVVALAIASLLVLAVTCVIAWCLR